MDKHGREQLLPGFEHFSHEQLLFISFGNVSSTHTHTHCRNKVNKMNFFHFSFQLWCETQTTIATKWALEDTHCPGRIRLKGVLANSNEFSEAFSCRSDSKMMSKKRCRIW